MSDEPQDPDLGEDRLPWLEAVEEEEAERGPSAAKLVGLIFVGLVAIGLVVGGLFWIANRADEGGGEGELIAAPEGDYKVKPADPGGLNVADPAATAQQAAQGAEPKGRIDTGPAPPAQPPPAQPRPQQPPAAPPAPQPQPPAAPSATIQLGAFSSQAAASRAWSGLSGRFRYLAPLSHSIVPVQSGGRTLYRLRATGPDAAGICRRLQVAGEACAVVG